MRSTTPHLDPELTLRRIAHRHHLPPSPVAGNLVALVERLVALHATDPATAHLSVHLRCRHASLAETAQAMTTALETDRTLTRWLCMRRTLHILPTAQIPTVLAIYRERLSRKARTDHRRFLVAAGLASEQEADRVLEQIRDDVTAALTEGPETTTELARKVPALGASFLHKPDKPYGARVVLGGRLLGGMGIDGSMVRAHTQGGWRSGKYSWAALARWLPDLAPAPPPETARRALVRRYLGTFGPASFEDIVWWTGLPKGMVRKTLEELGQTVVEVEVGQWLSSQLMLHADLEVLRTPLPEPAPGVALLPGLDPTIMGYKQRARFLDPSWTDQLFDRSGNAGPTVWWRGRVIGGWSQRHDGTVVWRLLAPCAEAEPFVRTAAEALERALGDERVMPRFPAPLTKALRA